MSRGSGRTRTNDAGSGQGARAKGPAGKGQGARMSVARVRVFAPATVSNVGPGFDVLGFALHRPGDTVEAELTATPAVDLVEVTGDEGLLPVDAARNAASVAASRVLESVPAARPAGIRLRLHKGMPLASGLGSSGASAAAGRGGRQRAPR